MGWVKRTLRIEPGISLGWWMFERVSALWVLATSASSGGLMTYLASISEWLKPWGPVGWGAVGMATFLLTLLAVQTVRLIAASARYKRNAAEFSQSLSANASLNPVDDTFQKVRVNLSDFYSPFQIERENVQMTACEIYGPASILINGFFNASKCFFDQCDFVVVKVGHPIHAGLAFKNSNFSGSKFHRVTFYLTADTARDLRRQLGANLNIISDGGCGEI